MKEYIEREALLNSFEELMNIACEQGSPRIGKAMRTGTCAGIAFCRNEVRHAPAADVVEVRHAKWDDYYKCTACGNEALLEEKPDPLAHGLNSLFFVDSDYCPHCGCKMDREE